MNNSDTEQFLSALFAPYGTDFGLSVELRTFAPDYAVAPGQPNAGPRQWHPLTPAGFAAAATNAAHLARRFDVYLGVLPRIARGGKAADLRRAGWLWADLDAGNETAREALARLTGARLPDGNPLPAPQILVRSGGGIHAYWRLAEVVSCADSADQKRLSQTLSRLVRCIGGDLTKAHACPASTDCPRILRLPGTANLKRQNQPRPVTLLRLAPDAAAFPLVWWRAHLPAEPLPPRRAASANAVRPVNADGSPCLPPQTVAKLNTPAPQGQRHYTMRAVAVAARKVGCDEFAIRNFAEQCGRVSGVCVDDPHEVRHLETLVEWTMRNVLPDYTAQGNANH